MLVSLGIVLVLPTVPLAEDVVPVDADKPVTLSFHSPSRALCPAIVVMRMMMESVLIAVDADSVLSVLVRLVEIVGMVVN